MRDKYFYEVMFDDTSIDVSNERHSAEEWTSAGQCTE